LSDAGFDLVAIETVWVWPHTVRNLDTGWDIKVPAGTWGSIKTRSSTFRIRKLLVLEGVIDSGYTGPLGVLVFNPTIFPKRIKKGERLAQLILIEHRPIDAFDIVNEMPITDRGPHGFGHTGR
jgi:dUTP pyrophosphatase